MDGTPGLSAIVVTLSIVAAACAVSPAPDTARMRAELQAADVAFARAVQDHDADAFAGFVAEDAVFYGSRVLHGRDEVVRDWTPFLAMDRTMTLEWHPTSAGVASCGNLGFTEGRYRLTTRNTCGSTSVGEGSYLTVWRRDRNGRWQAVRDIGTPPEPPAES